MNCEEFEIIGIDAERDPGLTAEQRKAAADHAWSCPRCSALQESWADACAELRAFAASTETAETPGRVEMRLRRDFRTLHHTMKTRRRALVASWALAGAAVLIGAISWYDWHISEGSRASNPANAEPRASGPNSARNSAPTDGAQPAALVASNDSGFTQLPGALFTEAEGTSVVRVRMPRSALSTLGLQVNEETASEWIQVDLLVTDDGEPQAVRLTE